MAEPLDTIRRVNADEPMTLDELYQARTVLDRHSGSGKTDVREARRRVGAMIDERMAQYEPAPAAAPTSGTSGATVATPAAKPDASQAKKQGNPVLGFIVLLVIVGTIIYACTNRSADSSGGGGDGRDEVGAAIVCEKFVKDRLRAPSTADFPNTNSYTITGTGTTYTVAGYVDAQNGFGAMIRSDWTCTVTETGTDGEFRLQSLTGLS